MTNAPERIWAFFTPDDFEDDATITAYEAVQRGGQEYTRTDIANARVAAAYVVAAMACTGDEERPAKLTASQMRKMTAQDQFAAEQLRLAWEDADKIRTLTPSDATAALAKMLDEARQQGRREALQNWEATE